MQHPSAGVAHVAPPGTSHGEPASPSFSLLALMAWLSLWLPLFLFSLQQVQGPVLEVGLLLEVELLPFHLPPVSRIPGPSCQP